MVSNRSKRFDSVCSLSNQVPLLSLRNESSSELYIAGPAPKNYTRHLRTADLLQDTLQSQEDATIVRFCPCTIEGDDPLYCPIQQDLCGFQAEGRMVCWTSSMDRFVGNFFPFMVLTWMLFLMFLMRSTFRGRLACSYFKRIVLRADPQQQLNKFFQAHPPHLENMIQRIESRDVQASRPPHVGDELRSSAGSNIDDFPILQGSLGNGGKGHLLLHTTSYSARTVSTITAEQDDNVCSICLDTLLEGMRVGKLTCHHEFHADCLKTWLKLKNRCPLCSAQAAGV